MADVSALQTQLEQALGAENVFANEPMSAHTTFKIGGPVQLLVTPRTVEQVRAAFLAAQAASVPVRVIGLGSNVLVADAGLEGMVIKLAENFAAVEVDGTSVRAQAGASNEAVARAAQAAGLAGYEFASGIPGTVGGAAIMNAGAYDGEFKGVCVSVTCLRPDGEVVEVSAEQADWGYRHSMMMDEGYVVLGAVLSLHADDPAAIQLRMDDLRQRRESKQPLEMPSAGSTFKRPEGYFAGKLIQDAGLRGYRVGGAQVSEKHTGFVVNAGGATAADVLQLITDVQDRVFAMEGVRLEPEVRLWK
ncbi:MAG: UDP-N-acetylmuramate dehydrogenase [Coriobacteriia bacterium]|nr:UDP-N-acetylmuramate dehydrogenase [Coriobacteriia bacterium]